MSLTLLLINSSDTQSQYNISHGIFNYLISYFSPKQWFPPSSQYIFCRTIIQWYENCLPINSLNPFGLKFIFSQTIIPFSSCNLIFQPHLASTANFKKRTSIFKNNWGGKIRLRDEYYLLQSEDRDLVNSLSYHNEQPSNRG